MTAVKSPFRMLTLELQMGAWCCTPCLHGRVSSRYEAFPDSDESKLETFNGDCMIAYAAGCFGLTFLPIMFKRAEIRQRFDIPGDGCTDCLLSCFCQPCALAQMSTELKDRSAAALLPTHGLGDNKTGYISPAAATGGMVYADSKPTYTAPIYTDAPPPQVTQHRA
jgi:Cys-rich protein (TIGR01571 family)